MAQNSLYMMQREQEARVRMLREEADRQRLAQEAQAGKQPGMLKAALRRADEHRLAKAARKNSTIADGTTADGAAPLTRVLPSA